MISFRQTKLTEGKMGTGAENICKFMPSAEVKTEIITLNFVYETKCTESMRLFRGGNMLVIVVSGEGELTYAEKSHALGVGDVFILRCAKEYTLSNTGGLEYMYITFTGSRTAPLLERIRDDVMNPVRHGCEELIPFWRGSLERAGRENSDLTAQSVLYYTFSYLAKDAAETAFAGKTGDTAAAVRLYIDENLSDPELCLSSIAAHFGYNPKYLSRLFRTAMGLRLTDYITDARMQCAKSLLKLGGTSVAAVAEESGYRDPLYFSKVYKKKFGHPPRMDK